MPIAEIDMFMRHLFPYSCRANLAQIRQSGPDAGLGFQVKVVEIAVGAALRAWGRYPAPVSYELMEAFTTNEICHAFAFYYDYISN